MNFLNIRLLHATNSSSTHSVIIAGSSYDHDAEENGKFGWGLFLQKTYDEKLFYMAQQLYRQLEADCGSAIARSTIFGLWGFKNFNVGHIDHQSEITMPKYHAGNIEKKGPAIDFYKELSESIANDPDVHIRGGNDNDGLSEEDAGQDSEEYSFIKKITELTSNALIARKQNDVWTLYNRYQGTKIHLNFNSSEIQLKEYRPETPELVDLKITDYCPYGCTFCYQGSTKEGKHAPLGEIETILWTLGRAEVFEVALGGGEPTLHPNFARILELCANYGITPNFTTKSLVWMKDPKIVEAVNKYCGAFAFSVTSVYEMKQFLRVYNGSQDFLGLKIAPTFQYILDAFPMKTLLEVAACAQESYLPLTLLGYKTTGRGGSRPYSNKGWIAELKSNLKYLPTIGIDTVITEEYADEIKEAGISERLYYKEEGRFSMYIDAVTKTFGKSSFALAQEMISYSHPEAALKQFTTWRKGNK